MSSEYLKHITSEIDVSKGIVSPEYYQEHKEDGTVFETDLLRQTASLIVEQSLKIKSGQKLLVIFYPDGWQLASCVTEKARQLGAQVMLRYDYAVTDKPALESIQTTATANFFDEPEYNPEMEPVKVIKRELEKGLIKDHGEDIKSSDAVLVIRSKAESSDTYDIYSTTQEVYDKQASKLAKMRGEITHCVTYVPSIKEAEVADKKFSEDAALFYRAAVELDWQEIKKAQSVLVEKLRGKKQIRIVAKAPDGFPEGWDTDVTMNIEGMIFANSTIDQNVPGSEVFSAPNTGSLNGVYAVPYEIKVGSRIIPNLKLVIKNGKVSEFEILHPKDAPQKERNADNQAVQKLLDTDKGSKIIGEIGIGTNPILTYPSINTLRTEKISGSVHLAIGNSYTDEYLEQEVKLDNGNRSEVHLDITRVLTTEYGGGTIEVDGEVIQKDGKFVDSELNVLNPS